MKNKGIPVWEMYFEYIVLGVAMLVAVGLVGWQFVGSKTEQSVAGKGEVTPSNVDQLLVQEAERIDSFVEPGAPLVVPIDDPEQHNDDFERELFAGVSPVESLSVPEYQIVLVPDSDEPVGVPFVEPTVPTPHTVLAAQYYDTLAESALEANTQLQDRFPEEPYDISWITTAATFDVADLLRQYRQGNGPQAAIPEGWYKGRPNVVDVEVEREELVNGGWTNHTVLPLLPGAVAQPLRDVLTQEITAPMRDDILEQLGEAGLQRAVIQPEFFETIANNWSPPEEREETLLEEEEDPEQRRLRTLQKQLRKRQGDLQRITQRLEELGGPLRGGSQPGGSGDDGGRGGSGGSAPGGGLGGAMGGGRRDQDDAGTQQNEPQRRRLTAQLDRLTEEVEKLRSQVSELQGFLAADDAGEELGLFEVDEWQLWAHDIDIEPGKTYRYRFTVKVYNPFFARRLNLIEEQHHLADDFTIASLASEWSEPIEARPPARFFVASARSADPSRQVGRLGLGQASVDVFRFQSGRWWRERFSVEPGERIGEPRTPRRAGQVLSAEPIDFTTDWFVVDVVENLDASDDDRDRGHGATVILQRIDSGEIVEWRVPGNDSRSPDRERLDGFVEEADLRMPPPAMP